MSRWPLLIAVARLQDLRDAHPVTGPERLSTGDGGAGSVWWALIALACAGLLLVLALRRRSTAAPTDEQWIQSQLAELQAATADPQFARRLTDFLRAALRRRFGLPEAAQTTSEIAAALDASPLNASARVGWLALLDRCDLAKFAGWAMTPAEAAQALRTAQTLLSERLSISESFPVGQTAVAGQNGSSRGESAAD